MSEKFAATAEKSVKRSEVNATNPERYASASTANAPHTARDADAARTASEPAIFLTIRLRSSRRMAERILLFRLVSGVITDTCTDQAPFWVHEPFYPTMIFRIKATPLRCRLFTVSMG